MTLLYHNGNGFVTESTTSGQSQITQAINISENSIYATFNVSGSGNSTNIIFWGTATEYTEYGNESKDWWGDWVPNSYFHVETKLDQNESNSDCRLNETTNNSNKINETEIDTNFTNIPDENFDWNIVVPLITILIIIAFSIIFLIRKINK